MPDPTELLFYAALLLFVGRAVRDLRRIRQLYEREHRHTGGVFLKSRGDR
ncbi:MAG: hypothetical protein ACOCYN_03825 [Planctomycetota bacterium]